MKRLNFIKKCISLILIIAACMTFTACKGGNSDLNEDFDIKDTRGKITIINFWGTWCPYCLEELPDFKRIAEREDVNVIAVHSTSVGSVTAENYIKENIGSSNITFLFDTRAEGKTIDDYYSSLGGSGSYPYTVILNADGVITGILRGKTNYISLSNEIANAEEYAEKNFVEQRDEGYAIGNICPTKTLKRIVIDN